MNQSLKWILGVVAATAIATATRRVFTLYDSSKTLSFLPRLDIKKIKLSGLTKIQIPIEVEANNASPNSIALQLRSLKLLQKSVSNATPVELAFTQANNQTYNLTANRLTILKGIVFTVPISSLLALLPANITLQQAIQNPSLLIPKGLILSTVFTANGVNQKIETEITA